MKIQTWKWEALIVFLILTAVWILTGCGWVELIATLAVQCTFMHAQIADRMQERQQAMTNPDVECHWKANYYFISKEILWIAFFALTGAYAAITGAVVFCAYPIWRKLYRKRFPIKGNNI